MSVMNNLGQIYIKVMQQRVMAMAMAAVVS